MGSNESVAMGYHLHKNPCNKYFNSETAVEESVTLREVAIDLDESTEQGK